MPVAKESFTATMRTERSVAKIAGTDLEDCVFTCWMTIPDKQRRGQVVQRMMQQMNKEGDELRARLAAEDAKLPF